MAGGLRERSVAIRRYGITYKGGIYLKKNKTMIVVFLTPAVLLFLGIFLYPIIRTVIMSFFKIDGVTDSMDLWKFVGFGNYTKLMSTSLFKTSFFNLFRIWLIGGLVVMSLSLLFAVILTSGIRGKKFFRAIIYMPNIVSAVALAKKIAVTDKILAHQRRDAKDSLSKTREKSWDCFYKALTALRERMKQEGIFEEVEKDFINYALHFSLWNLNTLAEPTQTILRNKLLEEWFADLGISGKNKEYFYNKSEYEQYAKLIESGK
mgnify:CR=1 FL=1